MTTRGSTGTGRPQFLTLAQILTSDWYAPILSPTPSTTIRLQPTATASSCNIAMSLTLTSIEAGLSGASRHTTVSEICLTSSLRAAALEVSGCGNRSIPPPREMEPGPGTPLHALRAASGGLACACHAFPCPGCGFRPSRCPACACPTSRVSGRDRGQRAHQSQMPHRPQRYERRSERLCPRHRTNAASVCRRSICRSSGCPNYGSPALTGLRRRASRGYGGLVQRFRSSHYRPRGR